MERAYQIAWTKNSLYLLHGSLILPMVVVQFLMLKKMMVFATFLFITMSFTGLQAASDQFICKCLAKGSGVDNAVGEKVCSYKCHCTVYNANEASRSEVVGIEQLASSARSKDSWDSGSAICHGQYAYKSKMSDPNWKIQVRFSPFTINSLIGSTVLYDEKDQSVEVAIGVRDSMGRSKKAPEILEALKNQI